MEIILFHITHADFLVIFYSPRDFPHFDRNVMHPPDRQSWASAYLSSPEKHSPRSSSILTRSSSPSSSGSFSDLATTLDFKDSKNPYAHLPASSRSFKHGLFDGKNVSKPVVLGVCAMDIKARSKAMREILTRLVERTRGAIEVKVFGDKVILDEGTLLALLCVWHFLFAYAIQRC